MCFLIFLAKAQESLKTLGTISSVLHVDSCTKLVGLDAPRPLDTSTNVVKALAFGNRTQGTVNLPGPMQRLQGGNHCTGRPSTRSTEASALPGLFLPAWIASSITQLKGCRMDHIQETVRVQGVLIRPQQSRPGIRRGEKRNNFKHWKASLGSVQFSSVAQSVRLFATPWTAAPQASLSITNSQSLLKLMSFESVMPSNHLILCCPLLLSPSIFPSIRVFSNESPLHIRWPKYWSFTFSISPSNEHPGLISFRMDWLDLLAVQGTLKSLLQHLSSKASILQHSAFFTVQLSYPYMTIRKNIALTRRTFVSKVTSLLFNMLSRLVITFLPRKHLLISWLQSPSAVILEPQNKV